MQPLKIYGFPPSTYTKTAMMVAKECGAPLELMPLEFRQASHYSKHPYGKMPALEHGEETFFETLAVVSYLDDQWGKGRLQPDEQIARARMLQWSSAAIDYAYEDLVSQLHDENPSPETLAAAAEQLKILNDGLASNAYFAGETLSLADFLLFPMVDFAIAKVGEGCLKRLSHLSRWHRLMCERPSVQEVVEA